MRSLEKRALDSLIGQLLTKIGDHARVVGPNGALSALDDRYVGVLKHLLLEAFPETPEALLTSVRDDLIVVTRAIDAPSELVGFEPSTLRVTKTYAKGIDEWREMYGDLLNVTIQPTRFIDTDLREPYLHYVSRVVLCSSIHHWMDEVIPTLCESLRRYGRSKTALGPQTKGGLLRRPRVQPHPRSVCRQQR